MWTAIIAGVLGGISAFGSNKVSKLQAKSARKTAELNAKLAQANFDRRTAYRNEELGQQVWNLRDQAMQLIGRQNAAMGASGFDVSPGDQRILADTLNRSLAAESGINRTYYLQQFEDELQTKNDILQYNFEAYAARAQEKQYSGAAGAFKIGMSALTAALGAYQPSGDKGAISSNTGAKSYVPASNATAVQGSSSAPWQSFGNIF